jgi:hypothetical protein
LVLHVAASKLFSSVCKFWSPANINVFVFCPTQLLDNLDLFVICCRSLPRFWSAQRGHELNHKRAGWAFCMTSKL